MLYLRHGLSLARPNLVQQQALRDQPGDVSLADMGADHAPGRVLDRSSPRRLLLRTPPDDKPIEDDQASRTGAAATWAKRLAKPLWRLCKFVVNLRRDDDAIKAALSLPGPHRVAPRAGSVHSAGAEFKDFWRLVFLLISAIWPRLCSVHIPNLNQLSSRADIPHLDFPKGL